MCNYELKYLRSFAQLYLKYGATAEAKKPAILQLCKDYKQAAPKYPIQKAIRLFKLCVEKGLVEEEAEKTINHHAIETNNVVRQLLNLSNCNVLDFCDWDKKGKLKYKASKDLTYAQSYAIKSIKQGPNGLEMGLHNKEKVLELLGRYHKLFDTTIKLEGPVPIILQTSKGTLTLGSTETDKDSSS